VTSVGATAATPPDDAAPSPSILRLGLYFLRLGTFGFGGPVALAGFMHRDLVERRRAAQAAPADGLKCGAPVGRTGRRGIGASIVSPWPSSSSVSGSGAKRSGRE